MPDLAKWARRDLETLRDSWSEFVASLNTPWTYIPGLIAAIVVAVMMALPILTDQ